MKIETRRDEDSAIDLTPMIDVVFLLLIFFMVTTTFLKQEKEMDINLPESESGRREETEQNEIVINVFKNGQLALGGVRIERSDLKRSLRGAAERDPEIPVTIRGDREVTHGRIVEVMDTCRVVGLANLALGTVEESE